MSNGKWIKEKRLGFQFPFDGSIYIYHLFKQIYIHIHSPFSVYICISKIYTCIYKSTNLYIYTSICIYGKRN